MLKFIKAHYFLLLILILAAAVRFYRLEEMANFDFDQEWAVNFAYRVVHDFPIQLIGQPLSIEGLVMGPWYFYWLTPFAMLFNLHPSGIFVGSVIFGLITIFIYYWVGKQFFGEAGALIAAGLRAFLFSKIEVDWTAVPAFHSDALVLLTLLCFYKYWHGKMTYLIPLGFLFGLYTSIHPILFPLFLVFPVLLLVKRKLPNIKASILSLVAFILPIMPLILFEFLHNFLEVKRLLSLFGGSTNSPKDPAQLIQYLQFNLAEPFKVIGVQGLNHQLLGLLFIGIIIYLTFKKYSFLKDRFHVVVFTTCYFLFAIYYFLFPAHVPEYYFWGLTTLSLFYIAGLLSLLLNRHAGKVLLTGILLYLLIINWQALNAKWTNPSLITLYHKDAIVKEILQRQPTDKYYISYIREPGWNFGFDYLFKLSGRYPDYKKAEPPVYTIVIPKSLSGTESDFSSGNIRLILPEN